MFLGRVDDQTLSRPTADPSTPPRYHWPIMGIGIVLTVAMVLAYPIWYFIVWPIRDALHRKKQRREQLEMA
jgi:peptidoglycan/LPS O-acetylase OafA/YrhL